MFSSPSAALVGLGFSFLFAAAPAAARFASIRFSDVKQCGSFSVDFVGGQAPDALPLTLSVLPLNGTPVFIPLPADAWNSTTQTGAAITFLPFPAGTQFIASLDDAHGKGTAPVSDVLVIDSSDKNDTSCLRSSAGSFAPQYKISDRLEQCEQFSVQFDATQGLSAPTIRGFIPKGASFPVNQSDATNATAGVATYTMDAERDSQVVFLLEDKNGHKETSNILPVFGDIQSSTSCIPSNAIDNANSLEMQSSNERVTPKIAVIVVAVCAGVIALVAIAMVSWYYFVHRRKARAQQFKKLDEAQDPSMRDPEKQVSCRISPPPRIITSVSTSPISPMEPQYGDAAQYMRNPPYTNLITPTSPDSARDPFGEQNSGSLLGQLSARESLTTRTALASAALGRNGATLPLPNYRDTNSVAYSAAARSSAFDPSTERMPGTSPYFSRLALTPDNSLASNADSILRRPTSTQTSTTVSSQEIDQILEMATIYGANDLPDLPPAAVTAPATIRSSAYMAGRESRRTSGVLSPRQSPRALSPTHTRGGSGSIGSALSHSASQSTLRSQATLRLGGGFRNPPLAPLPSSPLASPNARPSFDVDGVAVRDSKSGGLQVPRAPQTALSRNISSATRSSVYTDDGLDGLDGFAMLQAPNRGVAR